MVAVALGNFSVRGQFTLKWTSARVWSRAPPCETNYVVAVTCKKKIFPRVIGKVKVLLHGHIKCSMLLKVDSSLRVRRKK